MAKRYSEEERTRLLEAYWSSGKSQKGFCQAHGLSLATLGYWLRKARKNSQSDAESSCSAPAPAAAVVELKRSQAARPGLVSIELTSGLLIHCQAEQIATVLCQIGQNGNFTWPLSS